VVNEWKSHLLVKHIDARTRRRVASSLFLFRKALGQEEMDEDTKKQKIKQYIEKMSSPSPIPDGRFLESVRNRTRQLFPPGWDLGISSYLDAFTLPTNHGRSIRPPRRLGGASGTRDPTVLSAARGDDQSPHGRVGTLSVHKVTRPSQVRKGNRSTSRYLDIVDVPRGHRLDRRGRCETLRNGR
jgi:hypothetical protein